AGVLGPTSSGDLLVGTDVEGDGDASGELPAQVPDHVLVLDRRRPHDDPPGSPLQQPGRLHVGADATGDLHGPVSLFEDAVDQVAVLVVAEGGGVEVHDVDVVDTLLEPVVDPAERIVVQGDGVVDVSSRQPHRSPIEDVHPGV